MKVLILGSGGREHALAWRMAQDEGVERVFVMPGNPGMTGNKIEPLLKTPSLAAVEAFVEKNQIAFVMIGPEKFLFEGWVDALTRAGIPAVGPTRAAARLEESKAFSKSFMLENGIATARFINASTKMEALQALEQTQDWDGVVVKISGPALGKGVVVTDHASDAKKIIEQFYLEQTPGIEGGIVIEEKLAGRETSLFYACLDQEFKFLASACDHKRLKDGDQGPNTGGMGAISPSPWADSTFLKRVEDRVVRPTLQGMQKAGTPYRGILFIGLMGESLLEYNVRFGDPETQAILPLLTGNFTKFLLSMAQGDVQAFKAQALIPSGDCSIHIVKAARGYPGMFGEKIESNIAIETHGDQTTPTKGSQWFFAGVKSAPSDLTQGEARLLTSGGRVLGLSAWGPERSSVRARAYQELSQITFNGEQFRTDIGGSR